MKALFIAYILNFVLFYMFVRISEQPTGVFGAALLAIGIPFVVAWVTCKYIFYQKGLTKRKFCEKSPLTF